MRTVRLYLFCWLALAACGRPTSDPRQAAVVEAMAEADDGLLLARPQLVAGKYSQMSVPGTSFFRASLPVFLSDFQETNGAAGESSFTLPSVLVPCAGNPDPESFGTLLASDGSVGLELGSFDAASRAPFLVDVRRFAAGMALAANLANADDSAARAETAAAAQSVAKAGLIGYVQGIQAAAAGNPPVRITAPTLNPYLDGLLAQASAAAGTELSTETALDASGARHLIRGAFDPANPQRVFGDLPADAYAGLQQALADYQQTLVSPPPPEAFTVLDAVREYGADVASWPNVRAVVLIQGGSGDPADNELLEVREISDSQVSRFFPPGLAASNPARDLLFARAAWARPDADPLWGASTWMGLPVQIRRETAAARGLRVADLTGSNGTVPVLQNLALTLGTLLARLHSASLQGEPSAASAVWSLIAENPEGFEAEQAAAGAVYANQSLADLVRWQTELQSLGLDLGIKPAAADAPSADLAALFGTPPAPPPPIPPGP
jgi:hypothetical protein